MNAFEQMNWSIWQTLNDQEKLILMRQVLMYFVSPLTLVKDVKLQNFSMQGISCRTFEFTINGEPFVFVPGIPETILGFDQSSTQININEWLASDAAFQFMEHHEKINPPTTHELATFINEHTSQLRKATILPMLVSKYAVPVGAQFIGDLDTVSGNFTGDTKVYATFENDLLPQIYPSQTSKEALDWEFPKTIFEPGRYYGFLDAADNHYHLYTHELLNLGQLKKKLRRFNFYLPTEDEFEYMMTAGSRRLFPYVHHETFFDGQKVLPPYQLKENMFGLQMNLGQSTWQLLEKVSLLKNGPVDLNAPNLLEAIMPLSPYARTIMPTEQSDTYSTTDFQFYKVIRIKP
ncbi:DUF7278 family profilin-like fold-containing protein [Enterococcus timonensis]|uniref:DUF7278 family profilin-like fold-containing protein n=1 Tax=Enterococcus timonensis TaxID=1852364 RepID=UPI0008D92ADC|nr:hypothetical protein [Enterococcus timonensis]